MYGTWSYVQPNVCKASANWAQWSLLQIAEVPPNVCKVSANWSVVQTRGVWCLHQYARVQPMLNGVDTMELTPCSLLQIAEVQPDVCKVSANWAQWSLLQIAEVPPNVCKVTKKAQSIKQNTPKTNAHHCSSAVSARVKQNETATFLFC